MTARDWIRRAMGAQPYEKIWGPLLRGKFGDRADDISMAWLWGKLTMRRKLEGKEARQELLGYPRRSWEPLFGELRDRIEAGGGRVLIDRPAARLRRVADGFEVTAGAPGSFRTGHDPTALRDRRRAPSATTPSWRRCPTTSSPACSTTTSRRADRRPSTSARLERIEYHTALCLLLELDRRFSPFYWTNIADPELPFVGLVEHTNFVEPERYDGRRFLYVANYLAPGDPLLELDADALIERYTPGLRKVNPGFERSWVARALAAPRAGRAADRDRRLPRADPAAADRRAAASCSPTRRRSIPRTAGRTTPCGWAATRRRRCSRAT